MEARTRKNAWQMDSGEISGVQGRSSGYGPPARVTMDDVEVDHAGGDFHTLEFRASAKGIAANGGDAVGYLISVGLGRGPLSSVVRS